jgi:hypothetical protein
MLSALAHGYKFGPNALGGGSGAIQVVLSHTESSSTGSMNLRSVAPFAYGEKAHSVWEKPNEHAAPIGASEMVRFIQQAFALNVKQAASVLRVERRSIYHWMKRDDIQLHERTQSRVKNMHTLAQSWLEMGGAEHNGKIAHIFDGVSLVDLLSAESLDLFSIKRVMKALIAGKPSKDANRDAAKRALKHVLKELAVPNAQTKTFMPAPGQVAYVTDPAYPGMIVQLHHDGRKVPGRLKDGKFCPAEGE